MKSILFTLLTLAALGRNLVYLEESHSYYDTPWCVHFCTLLKILGNKKAFHERSILRNLFFDLIRCLVGPLVYPLMFHNYLNLPALLEYATVCIVLSILSTLFVNKQWFNNPIVAVIWSYLNIEFALMFADGFFNVMNQVERVGHGSMVFACVAVYLEMHFTL